MAAKEYGHGHDDNGLSNTNDDPSSQIDCEKSSNDLEVGSTKRSVPTEDTFRDETDSEVKYKTMAWWSVACSRTDT